MAGLIMAPSISMDRLAAKQILTKWNTSIIKTTKLRCCCPSSSSPKEFQMDNWDASRSADLYQIPAWGSPYFHINSRGHACVCPQGLDEVDLVELVETFLEMNVTLPTIVKFIDILQHRIQHLHDCFDAAITRYGYQGHFQGVFPIKCNHDRYILEDIVKFGVQYKLGLEAGSKPELLIAIAQLKDNKEALLICNGYKDSTYIECVLLATKLGFNSVIVLEQINELYLVLKMSSILGIRPVIGVRAKLSTKHNGHWGETSGDCGKFGLTTNEIVQVVYTLRREGMLDCLQLLHFHIGSQIPSISVIKEAMREGSYTYCELVLLGAPMGYIDVGGGLGIDYDGGGSIDYTMQNYANDVVASLLDACILKGVQPPVIISESGRALASHHSVLIFDVLNVSQRSEASSLRNLEILAKNRKKSHQHNPHFDSKETFNMVANHEQLPGDYLLSTFHEVYRTMDEGNFMEAFNDAKQFKLEATRLFKLGCLSLEQRAEADALYDTVLSRAVGGDFSLPTDKLKELNKCLAAVYHINLSMFRSAPDVWAIDQIFPVMPLQRLHERPNVQATLADLTCDSDGKIDKFIGCNGSPEPFLYVHDLQHGEHYYLGMFLAGVYQEIMGSAHNLFGSTNVVYVRSKAFGSSPENQSKQMGGYIVERIKRGQTMGDMLKTTHHDAVKMMEEFRQIGEEGVSSGRLTYKEAHACLAIFQSSIDSYTYLSK